MWSRLGIGWALDDSWNHVESVMGPASVALAVALVASGLAL